MSKSTLAAGGVCPWLLCDVKAQTCKTAGYDKTLITGSLKINLRKLPKHKDPSGNRKNICGKINENKKNAFINKTIPKRMALVAMLTPNQI